MQYLITYRVSNSDGNTLEETTVTDVDPIDWWKQGWWSKGKFDDCVILNVYTKPITND